MKRITQILACCLLSASTITTRAQENTKAESSGEKTFTIENCVSTFSMEAATKTKNGYRFWFVDKEFIDGRTLKLSVVAPGTASHPPHTHEADEFFFVLEGTARFHLDGDSTTAGPYTSFYCPSKVPHGISNAGDTELKYLVIKKYED